MILLLSNNLFFPFFFLSSVICFLLKKVCGTLLAPWPSLLLYSFYNKPPTSFLHIASKNSIKKHRTLLSFPVKKEIRVFLKGIFSHTTTKARSLSSKSTRSCIQNIVPPPTTLLLYGTLSLMTKSKLVLFLFLYTVFTMFLFVKSIFYTFTVFLCVCVSVFICS